MNFGSFLLSIFILLQSTITEAANIQELASLTNAAEHYVTSKLARSSDTTLRTQITVSRIDPRLRLTACDSEVIAFTPPGSRLKGNTTVGIRCDSPKRWTIYIPVRISIFQRALVAMHTMGRGHVIGNKDIFLDEIDVSRVRGGVYVDKAKLLGTKLKSVVKKDQVIDSASVCLICKGDSVLITAQGGSVSVSMAGIALNDGSKGDIIRVQNNASRRIISATITKSGNVSVVF